MWFDEDDIIEMQRRDREDEERAQRGKAVLEGMMNAGAITRVPSHDTAIIAAANPKSQA